MVLALLLASIVGCGGTGSSQGPDALQSDVVLALIELYDEPSRVGGTTQKTVLLRDYGAGSEVIDFAGIGIGPSAFGGLAALSWRDYLERRAARFMPRAA